jgi:hypothetical protein
MPNEDVAKWMSDPAYGLDRQDFDLVLADPVLLPQLRAYLDDINSNEEKKATVLMALWEILGDCSTSGANALGEEIKAILRSHGDFAERAAPAMGPIQELMVRRILNLPISSDIPEWVIYRAALQGGKSLISRSAVGCGNRGRGRGGR